MKTCIVCGAKKGLDTFKFKYGSVHVCRTGDCLEKLRFQTDYNSVPVITLSANEMFNPDWDDYANYITEKEYDSLTPEDLYNISQSLRNFIWELWDNHYNDDMTAAIAGWREWKEIQKVENTPDKDLPLLINKLEYEASKKLLERRLKNEKET